MDSIPIVAITGQVATSSIGKDAFQECDIMGIATPVTKYAFQPLDPAEVPEMVKKAFYISASGRPGPVLIDIPKDIQTGEAEMTFPEKVSLRGYNPAVMPDPIKIEKAVDALLNAERPLILAGGGVAIAGAFAELQALAEVLDVSGRDDLQGEGSL